MSACVDELHSPCGEDVHTAELTAGARAHLKEDVTLCGAHGAWQDGNHFVSAGAHVD